MDIQFLGGALEIGGSAILLHIDGKNILLDAGIRQGMSKDPLPNYRVIQECGGLDAIIISHAHLDHIGSLPVISKEYPAARIYMNHMTMDLVRVQLYDSLKVMNNREAEIPLYAEQDVISTLNRIFPIGYEVKFPIFDDIYLTFYNAGHIAGASFCYIQGKEGTLFYSGDFSTFSQKSIEGAKLPKLRPDVAIVESTYGDRLHSNREIEEKALVDFVHEAVENNGKVLIPAFALGRAQEVILILKSALNKGQLKNVKVYVDGLVRDVNRVYNRNPIYLKKSLGKKVLKGLEPFYDDNIIEVKPNDSREELLKEEQAVFVASSGMLTGGPSTYYAEKIAPMENGYIAITGYQDEESPGRQLLDLLESKEEEPYLKLNGVGFPVKGQIKKIGLSAHSDKSEIKGLIERLSARNVILVHGNNEVVKSLGQEIAADYKGRIYTPECGEQIHIEIRNPRKQLKKHIPYVMNHSEELSEKLMPYFYEYVREHYGNGLFTLEELYYIWHGVKCYEDEQIKEFKTLILTSVYFESDARRLFLWKSRNEQDIEEDLKGKELNQQQLTVIIEELFKEYPYKKISFNMEQKKVQLVFDFPHAVDSSIDAAMNRFHEQTGWNLGINETMNNNAAESLIMSYFSRDNVLKISFHMVTRQVQVVLNQVPASIHDIIKEFHEKTGWELMIPSLNPVNVKSTVQNQDYYKAADPSKAVEQNDALYLIDYAFEAEMHKPYKKSIKQIEGRKYIELAFITPYVGRMYSGKIQDLTRQTGWDIAISDKVNQMELINIVRTLCYKYQIVIKKNPSYHPENMSIRIDIISGQEGLAGARKEFKAMTGCELNGG